MKSDNREIPGQMGNPGEERLLAEQRGDSAGDEARGHDGEVAAEVAELHVDEDNAQPAEECFWPGIEAGTRDPSADRCMRQVPIRACPSCLFFLKRLSVPGT